MAGHINVESREQRAEEIEVDGWVRYAMRLGVNAALHPLEYSKTLMQLGFEPIPPRPGKSMFGAPILVLPNIFQYASHIRKVDGIFGCYRGLAPKIVGSLASMIASEKLVRKLHLEPLEEKGLPQSNDPDSELYFTYIYSLKRDLVLCVSGIIVSHPFRVVSVRMMAQFIGRETIYKSILGSAIEIWKTEGILGFFNGIIPELVCDVACLVLSSTTVYLVSKYAVKDEVFRRYMNGITQFFFSSILYPLQVVSTCMVVSGSRLKAGNPPIMPIYGNWYQCFDDLASRNELKRGSSVFWRSTKIPSRSVPSIISAHYYY